MLALIVSQCAKYPPSSASHMDTEGMGEVDWNELQNNLEATIPVYDRINRFATVGQVSRWRRMVANRLPNEGKILEIGCGPGSFAEIVEGRDLVCLDPIPSMIAAAEPRVNSKRRGRGDSEASFVKGEAEALPFDDSTFDGVCSLFSFRDWYDKRMGLSEALRVLKPGGSIVIVDPAKINRFHGWLGKMYMQIWAVSYTHLTLPTSVCV